MCEESFWQREDMLRQRTLRAARRARQTGKHFAGENAGQVMDLARCHSLIPEKRGPAARSLRGGVQMCFPAPSSGSPSRMSFRSLVIATTYDVFRSRGQA